MPRYPNRRKGARQSIARAWRPRRAGQSSSPQPRSHHRYTDARLKANSPTTVPTHATGGLTLGCGAQLARSSPVLQHVGHQPSSAQSPPPITLPARAVAIAILLAKKEVRYALLTSSTQPLNLNKDHGLPSVHFRDNPSPTRGFIALVSRHVNDSAHTAASQAASNRCTVPITLVA